MKEGYIPISRRLFEHPFWVEERVYSRFEAWIDLLQEARFEDTKELINNRLVTVTRGQTPISLRFLGTRWGWSTKKVNSFLDMLLSDKMITKETPKETGQTVVTICNYDKYNLDSETRKHQRKQTGNTEETPRKQQGNNINKYNKENNIISLSNNARVCEKLKKAYDGLLFDQVWNEPLMMNNHISPDVFKDYLMSFFAKLQNEDQLDISEKEAKLYFSRWLRSELYSKDKQNGRSAESSSSNEKPMYGQK